MPNVDAQLKVVKTSVAMTGSAVPTTFARLIDSVCLRNGEIATSRERA
jgi:hypothetical protein